MRSWRVPLRIARRDARRAKGRSILMLVMIALPVMGVTAADVLIQTQDVSSAESIDRRLGTAAAAKVFTWGGDTTALAQSLDPEYGGSGPLGEETIPAPTLPAVLATLGGERSALEVVRSNPTVATDKGSADVTAAELDARDPLAQGLYRLTAGSWPKNPGEVVVNSSLADRGPGLGESITITSPARGGPVTTVTRTVVGIAESAQDRTWEMVLGYPGSLPVADDREVFWLVGGGPVGWDSVEALNAIGALVVSRDQIRHPSAEARAADAEYNLDGGIDEATLTVAVLVVVMALIEVVLLAGPAFAVGARRQARPLALLAASGGTPQQARQVVLATGVVIGTAGAAAGVVFGIVGAWAIEPVLQRFNGSWFGPFDVPWLHLLGVAFFGFLSAVLAAVVPAWIASRQDVVAVLAGRRGDRKPSVRSPLVGLALLGGGVALAWIGTGQATSTSAIFIGLSAILCVLGMLLLVPVAVVGVARLGRYLPLALRFAVRDAARHRTRTTPAVAAVAATVAGVVAFGIAVTSDQERSEAVYQPQLPIGMASLGADNDGRADIDWAPYAAAVRQEASGVRIDEVVGTRYPQFTEGPESSFGFSRPDGSAIELSMYGGTFGTEILVYDGTLPAILAEDPGFDAAAAAEVLDAGGVVAFADEAEQVSDLVVRVDTYDLETGATVNLKKATVPGLALDLSGNAPTVGIVPKALAERLGYRTETVGLLIGGGLSEDQEHDIREVLDAMTPGGYLYVERGFEPDAATWIIQLVLASLGAILMLGGTLTATFLALSDARPDLATLSAVGAAPRTRRAVAAAYALAVGGIGAVLGVLVGFVPGIAVTYPMTSSQWNPCSGATCPPLPANFLDIPWLLIGGLVVVLPLLVAAVVWVFARSRLPLVSRLS